MRQELVNELILKYPELFIESKFIDIACDDGWFNLIDTICLELYSEYNSAKSIYENCLENMGKNMYSWLASSPIVTPKMTQSLYEEMHSRLTKLPKIQQIKEKFGSLRFYAIGLNKEQLDKVEFAQLMSTKICESCGSSAPNQVQCFGGIALKTLCNKCLKSKVDK